MSQKIYYVVNLLNYKFTDSPGSVIGRQTCVTGFSILIFSGNCAFVTKNVEIRRRCSSSTSIFISGYMIGSPTSDKAQCLGDKPSINRSWVTPVTRSQLNLLSVQEQLRLDSPYHWKIQVLDRYLNSWTCVDCSTRTLAECILPSIVYSWALSWQNKRGESEFQYQVKHISTKFFLSAALSSCQHLPGTPFICLIILEWRSIAESTISNGSSIFHCQLFPTGFVWCLQQKTHLLAHARLGVASMHLLTS